MKLTETQQDVALLVIAAWLGPQIQDDGRPSPTGQQAAHRAMGPQLVRNWDGTWSPMRPTPTIILEGGPEGWAYYAANDDTVLDQLSAIGIRPAAPAAYALCLHPKVGG